jgi:hypothetical protein
MSITRTNTVRRVGGDHFEPDDDIDPKVQRQLRGHLEQIDYTAYSANRQVLGAALGEADAAKFQRLGLACAVARARWVATALATAEPGKTLSREKVAELALQRQAFEELTDAYDALRRMVERGYLAVPAAPST